MELRFARAGREKEMINKINNLYLNCCFDLLGFGGLFVVFGGVCCRVWCGVGGATVDGGAGI